MKFAIITHVQHIKKESKYYGYAPYIREMNLWLKHVDEVEIVAPLVQKEINPIHECYLHPNLTFSHVSEFNITSFSNIIKTLFLVPSIFVSVFRAMKNADHIHLRCPGNMGLIGSIVQILFPKKNKTAKYAGNWDPDAKQPVTYKIQRWILSNTFLTKKMNVLVYGEWPRQTKNIKSFYTATYSDKDIKSINLQELNKKNDIVKFLFVGTLAKGKQPLYAIQLVEKIKLSGQKVVLELFGDGILLKELEDYISNNNLHDFIFLKGNQNKETIKKAYQESDFLILPSKSEGWPKVVAEAMFWGCIPIVTNVSCVSYMIDNGNRGILLKMNFDIDVDKIEFIMNDIELKNKMSKNASNWSQQFTIDRFESDIQKLLINFS